MSWPFGGRPASRRGRVRWRPGTPSTGVPPAAGRLPALPRASDARAPRAPAKETVVPLHRQAGRQAGRRPDEALSPAPRLGLLTRARTAVRAVRKRTYRHRRLLAPIWVLLALALAPSLAGLVGLSPLVAPVLGGGLTLAAALRSRPGWRRRGVVAALGAALTVWSWLALAFGVGPFLRWLLLALWLPGAVGWWRRQRVRSRITVREYPVRLRARRDDELVEVSIGEWWLDQLRHRALGRTWREARTELLPAIGKWWGEMRYRRRGRRASKRIADDWRRTASNAGVPGCRIRTLEWDRVACTIHVDLRRGQTHRTMLSHVDALGSALGADLGTLRIEPEKRMDRVRIRWAHDDPWAAPITYWDGETIESVTLLVTLGPYQLGGVAQLCLADPSHVLICGQTRKGKSSIAHLIVGQLAGADDVVIWVVDAKNRVEFVHWEPVLGRLTNIAGAYAMLRAARRVMEARQEVLRRAGRREWSTDLGPYLVLILDEFPRYKPAAKREAEALIQMAAFVGIRVVVIAQSPSAKALGDSTDLRDNLEVVIATFLKGAEAARAAFPLVSGWEPHELPGPGYFLMKGAGLDEPVPARADYPEKEVMQLVAARCADVAHELEPESAEAAAAADPEAAGAERGALASDGEQELSDEPADVEDDEEAEVPHGQSAPREAPADRAERYMRVRLPVLLQALRQAGRPVSGRAASELSDLPHGWTGSRGLPELERRGAIRRTERDEWELVEQPEGEEG
jgi:hypothetical protein